MVQKEDSKEMHQTLAQERLEAVAHAMSTFGYFDELDKATCREGCVAAKMKSFKRNDTLLGDGGGYHAYVYFLLSGKCQMIETLQIATVRRLNRNVYILYDPYVANEESDEDLEKKYFSSCKESLETTKQIDIVSGEDSKQFNIKMKCKEVSDTVKQNVKQDDPSISFSRSLSPDFTKQSHIPPGSLNTYFMQVCVFNPGSTFGIGENMRDRRIIALTSVECMLLPKVWLMQHNTADIWTRIRNYLEKKIPSKKYLFEEFVSARRWQEHRNRVVEEVASRGTSFNWTTIHDVPYSVRLSEMITFK